MRGSILWGFVASLAGSTIGAFAQTIPVPSQYQDLYTSLNGQITAFNTAVKGGWNGSPGWNGAPYPVLFSPQLSTANSNQYQSLLQTYTYSNAVLPQLEEIQALGGQAVTVHIDFPILYQPFYTSNPAQYQKFVSFYQQLASDVHARGLKLIVESSSMLAFTGTQGSAFTSYYNGLAWTDYVNGRAQNALNIVQLIHPDYLSVMTEPDTEANAAGQPNVNTVSGSTQIVQTTMSLIEQAGPTTTQVGAGAGTWLTNFSSFISSFAATDVQYIDLHLYPINHGYFTNILSAADTAHAAGKAIAMSETWEQKVRDSELLTATPTQIYARDPFTFWQPVDTAFQKALVAGAQWKQFAFVSPFWSQYFFANLDFNTYGSQSNVQILNAAFAASSAANQIGGITPTGLGWENTILPNPDIQPPATPVAPTATTVYDTTLVLTWPTATDNIGVAGYNLYRNGMLILTTTLFQYMDQNLTPGATYTYTMTTFDAAGNPSAASPPLIVTTVDTTPPTPPGNLTVTGQTSSSVTLTWTPSTGIQGVAGYMILRGTSPKALTRWATTTALTYTDATAVRAGTMYYYEVEGYLSNNIMSSPSNEVSTTTPSVKH